MEINSICQTSAKAVEGISAEGVLSNYFKDSSPKLMKLISAYYQFLNEEGLPNQPETSGPSYQLNNLGVHHDIDINSEYYLDAIGREIALNIPKAASTIDIPPLDKRRLYKIITRYYNARGSDDSVFAFFRIFYNETVSLFFPKELLFDTSGVRSVTSSGPNQDSLDHGSIFDYPPDQRSFVIRDSYFWQEYSYVINKLRDNGRAAWIDEYLRFVHPAGMQLFAALSIIGIALNDWLENPEQGTEYLTDAGQALAAGSPDALDPGDYWKYIDWDKFIGQHTPKIQACIGRDPYFFLKILTPDNGYHYLTHIKTVYGCSTEEGSRFPGTPTDETLLRAFYRYVILCMLLTNRTNQLELFYNWYSIRGKFIDSSAYIDGYADYKIEDTYVNGDGNDVKPYDPNHYIQFKSLATTVVDDDFEYSSFVDESDLTPCHQVWYLEDSPGISATAINSQVVVSEDYNLETIPSGIVSDSPLGFSRNIRLYAPIQYQIESDSSPPLDYALEVGGDIVLSAENNWTHTAIYELYNNPVEVTPNTQQSYSFLFAPTETLEMVQANTVLESLNFVWNFVGDVNITNDGPTDDFVYYTPTLNITFKESTDNFIISSDKFQYTTLGEYINSLTIHDDLDVIGLELYDFVDCSP